MVETESMKRLRKLLAESEFDDIGSRRKGVFGRRDARFDDLIDYLAAPTPVKDKSPVR